MFSRSALDVGVVLAYVVLIVVLWVRRLGQTSSVADYLVAGRRVTLPAFVATLVSTWYGGVLGVGEYSFRYGISNWLVFGVPYYVGALLFALFFARRARAATLFTIPDLLERHYGRGPALVGALAVFVTAVPAAYVLMLGTLLSAMFGWPLAPSVAGAALFSVFYIQNGGMRTVLFTDQIQFVLMYAGFAMLLVFLVVQHGALPLTPGALPDTHFTWHGGNPVGSIVVWYVIALSALVDPAFWQRASAAQDPKVAQRGVLISIAFWIVFDFMTTTAGLYARALMPALEQPVFAFPELARLTLPPLALGLFYLGMLASVMGAVDSYGFIAATTWGRDIVWRLRRDADESKVMSYSKVGLWISAIVAALLAVGRPSVVALWRDLGSIATPALLLPVGTALLGRGRLRPPWTLAAMAAAFVVSLVWVLRRGFAAGAPLPFPWSIEAIYVGLGTSLAIYAAGWLARKDIKT